MVTGFNKISEKLYERLYLQVVLRRDVDYFQQVPCVLVCEEGLLFLLKRYSCTCSSAKSNSNGQSSKSVCLFFIWKIGSKVQ